MAKTLFFLVTEKAIDEDGTRGYTIGTKDFPKTAFVTVATHGTKAVVLRSVTTKAQYEYGTSAPEYLGSQYQQLILDSLLGLTNPLIAKKCMNVRYQSGVVTEGNPTYATTSVEQWELDGFPGQGTHQYSKAIKIFGVETE